MQKKNFSDIGEIFIDNFRVRVIITSLFYVKLPQVKINAADLHLNIYIFSLIFYMLYL